MEAVERFAAAVEARMRAMQMVETALNCLAVLIVALDTRLAAVAVAVKQSWIGTVRSYEVAGRAKMIGPVGRVR
jgi:hypothetical protein